MNIFILSLDPVEAAQMQCDKHVPKMLVESGQMLSTAHRVLDGKLTRKPSKSGKTMVKYWDLYEGADDLEAELLYYKAVHVGHPCTVWSRENCCNYTWHYKHFIALCDEYTYRYGKTHSTDTKLREVLSKLPDNIPREAGRTPFKLAMKANPECVVQDLGGTNAVESYRKFYKTKEKRFKMDWTKRPVPEWFKHANV